MNKKTVIYSRVSTTNGQTVDNQLNVLREVAEKKGLEIVKEISDEGISGAKGRDEREGFDELIKGSIKREWDIILCWDVSRLSRSLKHLVSFLDDIHSAKCDLYIHQSGSREISLLILYFLSLSIKRIIIYNSFKIINNIVYIHDRIYPNTRF